MKRITLSENHSRALRASVYVVEKLITELEQELTCADDRTMEKIITDDDETMKRMISVIQEIKSYIRYMAEKYALHPSSYSLSQIVNSRKTKIWEVLCDTKSAKMRSRGVFPKEYAQEFDADIEGLLKLTESI